VASDEDSDSNFPTCQSNGEVYLLACSSRFPCINDHLTSVLNHYVPLQIHTRTSAYNSAILVGLNLKHSHISGSPIIRGPRTRYYRNLTRDAAFIFLHMVLPIFYWISPLQTLNIRTKLDRIMSEEAERCQEDALLLSFGRVVASISDDEEVQCQSQRTLHTSFSQHYIANILYSLNRAPG